MKQEISNHLANGLGAAAGGSAIATGVMGFFSYYAAGIGAIFTILTFITWVFFQLRHDKKLSLADSNQDKITSLSSEFEEHKKDTVIEFANVNKGIFEILSKLNESDKQG